MITPHLEKMCLQGKAEYAIHVQGMASGRIVVPSDKSIVITDIWYYHFVDAADNEDSPNRTWNDRSIHQMKLYSKKKSDHFVIRETLIKGDEIDGVTQLRNKSVFGQSHFDTYLMHADNVYIEINAAPSPTTWINISNEESPDVQELQPRPPNKGYGKGLFPRGIRYPIQYDFNANFRIKAYRQRFAPPVDSQYEQLTYPINGSTAIQPPIQTDSGNMQYPIVNIAYVIINDKAALDVL